MNKKTITLSLLPLALGGFLALGALKPVPAQGQCCFIPPTANILTSSIAAFPEPAATANALMYLTVQSASFVLPAPTSSSNYLTWCLEFNEDLDVSGSSSSSYLYSVSDAVGTLYSTCDPNLSNYSQVPNTIPSANWNAINYLLNHKSPVATYMDVQYSLWSLMGAPPLLDSSNYVVGLEYAPPVNPANVLDLVSAALANTKWTPACGDTIGEILVLSSTALQSSGTIQVLMLEIQTTNNPPTANCVSISATQGAAITPTTVMASGGCGGPYTFWATGLPAGLTMSTSGTISGTSTGSGTFYYDVSIEDSCGNVGGISCSVVVNQPPPPNPPTCNGQIGDFVWQDLNGNGCQDAGEPGIPGVKVDLYSGCGVDPAYFITTTNTDANGHYLFSGLCTNNLYTVSFTTPAGYARTVANAGCANNPNNPPYSNQTDSKCVCLAGSPCGICLGLTPDNATNLNMDCGYVILPSANCATVNAVQGVAITPVTLTGSGGCGGPYTFSATGLPTGLSMSTGGMISGTTSASTGTTSYTVTITDNCTNTGTFNCSVTVQPPPSANCVTITDVQGVAITPVTLTGSGGCGGPYTFTAAGLPAGLVMSSGGTISGSATIGGPTGVVNYNVTIKDTCGNSSTFGCSVTVHPPPSASCVTITDVQGVAITPVTLIGSGGCGGPYTFTATGLPAGLTMSSGGTISGTATIGGPTGLVNYSVTVKDNCGNSSTFGCSVTVHPPPSASCVTITDVQGVAITPVTLTGSGGCGGPYTFTATGLPAGLVMSSGGTVSGTATIGGQTGVISYNVTIKDSCGNSSTFGCSVTVQPPPSANCVTIANAVEGVAITPVTLTGSGGCGGSYTFTATGLPAGLTMSPTGTISGTPTVNGTFNYSVTIKDHCGDTSTFGCSVTVKPSPPIVTCPPDITLTNVCVPYCTYTPGDYGAACNGANAASILTNCFGKVYTNGYAQCGYANNSGYWLKFTSCTAAKNFVGCGGTPGCLNGNYSNPSSCSAGTFAGQVLCLKLNVDFGDCKSVTGFSGGCGDLILNDPTCPLNGNSVRQILGLCHTALGGGNISSSGCTISALNVICSNLNQSFEGGNPSAWCQGHLVPATVTNISPKVTGYATVVDSCTISNKLTYSDVVTAGTCPGNYVIARTWWEVDGCGNSNSCTQNIYVGNSLANVCGSVFMDCNGDGFLTPGVDSGLTNITVILKNSANIAVATNHTDAQGDYCFYNLAPGTYTVSIAAPANNVQTAGTHTYHWLNGNGQQCWVENDGYQHCKGANGVDCWSASDGYQHWKNSNNQDCWADRYGYTHTQACTYVSCDVPKTNSESFTLTACQSLSCVNFSYKGTFAKPVVCVTGPSSGSCGQTATYTCCVTNTGTACFSTCQVTACGQSFTCPALSPGQGCSFPVSYQYQFGDCGSFNCQATATCSYPASNNPCTAQGSCSTQVSWSGWGGGYGH